MQKNLLKFGLFIFAAFSFVNFTHAQFSDAQKDSLTYMYSHGIIDGYSDGTFRPNNPINRAELLKIIMDASHKKVVPAASACFNDVANNTWYAPYICTAKANNWIEGYEDGSFKPEKNINKVETLKIISKIQNWAHSDQCRMDFTPSFKDLIKCAWYYNDVIAAADNYYVDPQVYFYPGKNITRAEVAEILFRTILSKKLDEGITPGPFQPNDPKTDLASLARDFFKIEADGKNSGFDKLVEAKSYAEKYPLIIGFDYSQKDPSGKYIAKPDYFVRQVMLNSDDGYTYGVMPIVPNLELESNCYDPCLQIWMVAKFDHDKKLIAFDWLGNRLFGHYSVTWNLISAKNNHVEISALENGPGIIYGVGDQTQVPSTIFDLEDLR